MSRRPTFSLNAAQKIVVHDVADDIVLKETMSKHLPWHQLHARRSRHLLVLRMGLIRRYLNSVHIERRVSGPIALLVDAARSGILARNGELTLRRLVMDEWSREGGSLGSECRAAGCVGRGGGCGA